MIRIHRQPLGGLILLSFVVMGSTIFIAIGEKVFQIDSAMLAVYALFFVWTAFVISLCDRWPIQEVKQPWVGFVFLAMALVVGILHPLTIGWMGYGTELYWPLISNLFLAIGIILVFDNPLATGTKQPKSVVFNILFMYVFAIILILAFGMVPAIWFAMFVFLFFWLDRWPVSKSPQPSKGILLFVIMAAFALILESGFHLLGTSFFRPDAGLWFVIWVWWLVATSWQLETWPVRNMSQPAKGMAGLAVTVILTFVTYWLLVSVLGLEESVAGAYAWVFVAWLYTWHIVLGKWPTERSGNLADERRTRSR